MVDYLAVGWEGAKGARGIPRFRGSQLPWFSHARIHADSPLDVMLVHFSSVPRGAYGDLEKGRKKVKAVARPGRRGR